MRLKRLYDWDAPKAEWATREEQCATCNGKGVVINDANDGVVNCPDCEDGVRQVSVPPVSGVEVEHAGPEQHFSTRIIDRGLSEGWMSIANGQLSVNGENRTLVYDIKRAPGTYKGERINYYDCALREDD